MLLVFKLGHEGREIEGREVNLLFQHEGKELEDREITLPPEHEGMKGNRGQGHEHDT
jgi:hypothetical protein